MIKRKTTASVLMPTITKREGLALCFPSIRLEDRVIDPNTNTIETKNSFSFTTMDNNKFIRMNEEEFAQMDSPVVLWSSGGTTKSFATDSRMKSILSLIQLDYGSSVVQKKTALIKGVYMDKKNYCFYIHDSEDENYLYDIMSKENRIRTEEAEGLNLTHYSCIGNSPSGERKNVILLGSDEHNWSKIINKASDGFLSINDGEKTYKQMAKESSKLFQCLAGSVSLGTCNRIAIIFDKFRDDKFDGMCYGSSEALSNHIKEAKNIDIYSGALNGMFIQGRIAQGKYGYIVLPNSLITKKINYKIGKANVVEFSWEDMTFDVVQAMINGEYDKKCVIIGDSDKPIDILMDKNTAKSVWNYAIKPEYTILRVLKNNSPVKFSSTIFSKLLAKDSKAAIAIAKWLYKYDLDNVVKKQLKSDGRILGLDTFESDNLFMRDILVGGFPEYVRRDKNVALDCVKNIVESANKKVSKLGFAARGSGKGIVVGPENLYNTECLLGEFEMYNRHLIQMFAELGIPEKEAYVVGFKYPTMDIDEYEVYRLVSLNELKSRIHKISNPVLENLIEREYYMYQDSVAVMPCSEVFKQKHAGSDFDTDMMQFLLLITDTALEIIQKNKPELYEEMKIYNRMYHAFAHEPVIVKITQ